MVRKSGFAHIGLLVALFIVVVGSVAVLTQVRRVNTPQPQAISQQSTTTLTHTQAENNLPQVKNSLSKDICANDSDCVLLTCAGPFNKEYAKTLPPDLPCRTYEGNNVRCAANRCTAVPWSNKNNIEREKIFENLTRATWCDDSSEARSALLAPSISTYEFNRSGRYHWARFSDYPEGEGSGRWNFKATGLAEGVIVLESGDVIHFVIDNKNILSLGFLTLKQCDAIKYNHTTYSAASISSVEPSPLFKQIVAHIWEKTDSNDLFRLPSRIQLKDDGTYFADFRNGECSYKGTWSLMEGNLVRQIPAGDNCDLRSKGESPTSTHSYKPRFVDGKLIFEESAYVPVQ